MTETLNTKVVKVKRGRYISFIMPDIPQWFVTDFTKEKIVEKLLNKNVTSKYSPTITIREEDIAIAENLLKKLRKLDWSLKNETKKLILKTLDIEVTNACNLKCLYCYNDSGLKLQNELTLQEFEGIFCEARKLNVDTLTLSGGEPFLRNDLRYIAKSAVDLGIKKIQILTNGTLIKNRDVRWIKDLGITLQLSLDGSTASINDTVRGKGTYRRIIKILDVLKKSNIEYGLSCTILRPNLMDFPDYLNLSQKYGAKFIRLGIPTLMGRALRNSFLIPSITELIQYYKEAFQYLENTKSRIRVLEISYFKGRISNIMKRTKCAGNFALFISSDGNVFPCFNLRQEKFLAGNVRNHPLEYIFRNSSVFKECRKNRVDKIFECGGCELRYFCGGGCAGRAYSLNRNMYTSDPLCPLLKSLYLNAMFSVTKYPRSNHCLL